MIAALNSRPGDHLRILERICGHFPALGQRGNREHCRNERQLDFTLAEFTGVLKGTTPN